MVAGGVDVALAGARSLPELAPIVASFHAVILAIRPLIAELLALCSTIEGLAVCALAPSEMRIMIPTAAPSIFPPG